MPSVPSKYTELIEVLQKVEEAFIVLELIQSEWKDNPRLANGMDLSVIRRLYDLLEWKRTNLDA